VVGTKLNNPAGTEPQIGHSKIDLLKDWSVSMWVRSLSLKDKDEIAKKFEEEGIEFQHLKDADHNLLEKLGVAKLGDRMTIQQKERELRFASQIPLPANELWRPISPNSALQLKNASNWLFRNPAISSKDDALGTLPNDFLFGIDHIRCCANAWLNQTYLSRHDPTNWKQMLLVHGPVKSSKTTIIQPGGKLEYVLRDKVATDANAKQIWGNFRYFYVNCENVVAKVDSKWNLGPVQELWRAFYVELTKNPGVDLPEVEKPTHGCWITHVELAFCSLGHAFCGIDEYHFLFSKLSEEEARQMGMICKLLFLDQQSNLLFAAAGSSQAAFYKAINYTSTNGQSFVRNLQDLPTDFQSPDDELDDAKAVLVHLYHTAGIDVTVLDKVISKLPLKTTAGLAHIATMIVGRRPATAAPPSAADIKRFVSRHVSQIFVTLRRDYSVLPWSTLTLLLNHTTQGLQDPSLMPFSFDSLVKHGTHYYFQDRYLYLFLKLCINHQTQSLSALSGIISDVNFPVLKMLELLFLIPTAENRMVLGLGEKIANCLPNAKFSNCWRKLDALSFKMSSQGLPYKWLPKPAAMLNCLVQARNLLVHSLDFNGASVHVIYDAIFGDLCRYNVEKFHMLQKLLQIELNPHHHPHPQPHFLKF